MVFILISFAETILIFFSFIEYRKVNNVGMKSHPNAKPNIYSNVENEKEKNARDIKTTLLKPETLLWKRGGVFFYMANGVDA